MSVNNESPRQDDRPLYVYILRFLGTLALSAAIGLAYLYKERLMSIISGEPQRTETSPEPATAGKAHKKIKYWRAPMDPTYIRNEPGKSPMGMDLIPVYEEDGAEEGMIKINPQVVQNIGVRTARAERVRMTKKIRTVGLVTYDETKLAKIQSKVEGWVEKLYIDYTGMSVKKDTILLELYSPDLVATQEEFLLALKYRDALRKGRQKTIVEGSESLLESTRRRLELFDVPAHQIRELEKTGKVKKTLHIHSPANGIVIRKNIIEGMFIKPGTTLYEIADLKNIWVNVDVYEYEIPYVKVGQKARMTLASFPGREFDGVITYIYPFMDAVSRTVKVRLEFDNTDMELKPDMYGDVVISAGVTKQIVAIPTEAVVRTGSRAMIFIDKGEGKFEPREVTIGLESGGKTEIISGVEPGESIVTSAQFLLDSESKLREAVNKMTSQPVPDESKANMDHSKMDHGSMDHGSMDSSGQK